VLLEPIFVRNGVNVVFSGHDHVYERIKPQHDIYYFVSGSAGQLRPGDLRRTELTAAGYRGQQRPYDAFFGARYAVVEDPDGNPVGLMSPVEPARRSSPPTPAPR